MKLRYNVVAAVTVKTSVFWYMTPGTLVAQYHYYAGTYHPSVQATHSYPKKLIGVVY